VDLQNARVVVMSLSCLDDGRIVRMSQERVKVRKGRPGRGFLAGFLCFPLLSTLRSLIFRPDRLWPRFSNR
jgi:hypothetical protein